MEENSATDEERVYQEVVRDKLILMLKPDFYDEPIDDFFLKAPRYDPYKSFKENLKRLASELGIKMSRQLTILALHRNEQNRTLYDLEGHLTDDGYLDFPEYPYAMIRCMFIVKRVQGEAPSHCVGWEQITILGESNQADSQHQLKALEKTKEKGAEEDNPMDSEDEEDKKSEESEESDEKEDDDERMELEDDEEDDENDAQMKNNVMLALEEQFKFLMDELF